MSRASRASLSLTCLFLFLLLAPLPSCATGRGAWSAVPLPPVDAAAFAARLEADTQTRWGVTQDAETKEARMLVPARSVRLPGSDPEDVARSFFRRYRSELHASGESDEIELISEEKSSSGVHLRFQHHVPGSGLVIPDVVSTFDINSLGETWSITSSFDERFLHLSTADTLSKGQAIDAVKREMLTRCGSSEGFGFWTSWNTKLAVHGRRGGPPALAYLVPFQGAPSCPYSELAVDARTGALLQAQDPRRF